MASYNRIILVGNLTRDPELRFTAGGSALTKFGLAVNRKYKQGEEWKEDVCFVDITVWGKQAETCAEYLSKGKSVFIDGRLNFSSWESKEGQKRNKLDVVANSVQFLGNAVSGGASQENSPDSQDDQQMPEKDDIPF